MELQELINDDDAVSPVIGVILMVAITVILAAVIGTFVLGLGSQVQTTAPNAQFSFDFNDGATADSLTVVHEGGDGIEAGEVMLTGDVDTTQTYSAALSEYEPEDSVRAGSSVVIEENGNFQWPGNDPQAPSDAEVRVVWQDSDSEQSSTLRTWTRD